MRSRAWLVAGAVLFVLVLGVATIGVDPPGAAWAVTSVALGVAIAVTIWALLRTRSQRREYEAELAAWAAQRARQSERLRIAGDLHDLVSHGLGLITVRAAVARRTDGPDGDRERAVALADIERAGRETTTELRRMLTVLRTPGAAPLHPADTMGDLYAIVDAANCAGLEAILTVGELGAVSPGVQLTVCAVVREALHNTLRHAGPTLARVDVQRDAAAIVVGVEDAGSREPWQPHGGAGRGLDGLRERVAVLGGTLRVDTDGPGFRLTARIPDEEPA